MSSTLVLFIFIALVVVAFGETRKCSKNTFGMECRHHCRCKVNTTCDEQTGKCAEGCAPGWEGDSCQTRDVAFTMPAVVKGNDGNASWAVDGNVSTCAVSPSNGTGWWKLDLLADYKLYRFRIVTDTDSSLKDWRVFVSPYDNVFFTRPCTTLRMRGHVAEVTCDTPMMGQYVGILAPPGPFHLCEFKLLVCENYSFGSRDCDSRCRCRQELEICDGVYGTCRSGCPAGWSGANCQTACNMSYGMECVHSCGHCHGGGSCDSVTGHCRGGCDPGWTGSRCKAQCPSGWWGRGCRQECGHCEGGLGCDPVQGTCASACQTGWTGDTCLKECAWGRHGENCALHCGHCFDNATCDRHTGICPHGCQDGWEGVFCNHVCLYGRYGAGCSRLCGHCARPPCDVSRGLCGEAGCLEGWSGPQCETACPAGRFGAGCLQVCGRCLEGGVCDTGNGTCPNGCLPGWNGTQCLQPCAEGLYGEGCASQCGNCAENAPCDHVTGSCPNGCKNGFIGITCTTNAALQEAGREVVTSFMGVSVGIFGTVMAVVVVCLVLKWKREYSLYELREQKCREEEGILI